jgi:hypothetical protein
MSRLRSNDAPASRCVQTCLKLPLFLPDVSCPGMEAFQLAPGVASAGQLAFVGSLGARGERPGKTRNSRSTEQSSRKRVQMSGADSVVPEIPRRYNPAERREVLSPAPLRVRAVPGRV